jgi:hypothetical protein
MPSLPHSGTDRFSNHATKPKTSNAPIKLEEPLVSLRLRDRAQSLPIYVQGFGSSVYLMRQAGMP